MESQTLFYRISPESLKSDIVAETYSGDTGLNSFGVYSGMSYILSGGTGGTSLLTGLTIPILFTQTYNDIGVYTEFDGLMEQKDVITNFLYSGFNEFDLYQVRLYNTSEKLKKNFLEFTNYTIDWGDGSPIQTITNTNDHTYAVSGNYTITMSGTNVWGVTIIQKPISVPLSGVTVDNPNGAITYTPMGGSWPSNTQTMDYIFQGDNENQVANQISSNYTTVPFNVSGYTKSRLTELRRYGANPYTVGYQFFKNNEYLGEINSMTPEYTSYTINNIVYYDLVNGKTFYVASSSGVTENDIVASAITKNEYMLDFVMNPEIQSDIYIERGKYSGFEALQRLGEVDNIGDMVTYGYGFYKINTT